MKKGQIVEVEVHSFTKRGNGLAKREEPGTKGIEVPFALVGEKVSVALHGKSKGLYRGKLQQVVRPSPHRIEPRCAHFGSCGGCRWQQLEYDEQLRHKQEFVARCFGELCKEVEQRPIIPCSPPWGYRNKMEFSFSQTRKGERYLGLMQEGPYRDVFNIEECHLCSPWCIAVTAAVREWWQESGIEAFDGRSNAGSLRTLTLREGMRTGDRLALLTVSGNPDYALTKEQLNRFVAVVRSVAEPECTGKLSLFLRICQTKRGTPTTFFDMHLYGAPHLQEELHVPLPEGEKALRFAVSPGAFFQPNTLQAEKLYGTALQLAEVGEKDHVFDLYCGTGTLGICAALRAAQVTGVELSPESACDAQENVEQNNLKNVEILCSSVNDELGRLQKRGMKPDVVMVDPPRAGLDLPALEQIAAFGARRLVYVSCNPVTQGENIRDLVAAGYRLEVMQAVDQFPHTAHIENVALMVRE